MRNLTPEECEFIAGGDNNYGGGTPEYPPEIVVVASPPPYYPPYYPPYEPPQPPSPPPYYDPGSGGSGGGSGTGNPGDNHAHTSPGGVTYEYDADLSPAQLAVVDKIVDYGKSHGYTAEETEIAVRQAFYESSLGTITSNPGNSDVQGLYQYDSATWSDRGHGGADRGSVDNQIAAFFGDIRYYEGRYQTGQSNGQIPSSLTFEQYMEVKHHLGSNSTNWSSPVVQDYQNKSTTLGFDM